MAFGPRVNLPEFMRKIVHGHASLVFVNSMCNYASTASANRGCAQTDREVLESLEVKVASSSHLSMSSLRMPSINGTPLYTCTHARNQECTKTSVSHRTKRTKIPPVGTTRDSANNLCKHHHAIRPPKSITSLVHLGRLGRGEGSNDIIVAILFIPALSVATARLQPSSNRTCPRPILLAMRPISKCLWR